MSIELVKDYDVLVGSGINTDLVPALSAAETPGIKIATLEAAPKEDSITALFSHPVVDLLTQG
jgi:hypothetical protein